MLEFIKMNIGSIAVIVLTIIILLVLYKKGKTELVRLTVLSLVAKAEKTLGSGTGDLKYALVVESLYKTLPLILTSLFSKKEIDNMIINAVKFITNLLNDGKTLLGYEEEMELKMRETPPPETALD